MTPGCSPLAEARWRTGDLAGAGEAAQAYLATVAKRSIALVIAAEAVAAVGRPGRRAGSPPERSSGPMFRSTGSSPGCHAA